MATYVKLFPALDSEFDEVIAYEAWLVEKQPGGTAHKFLRRGPRHHNEQVARARAGQWAREIDKWLLEEGAVCNQPRCNEPAICEDGLCEHHDRLANPD
jgi:hypothetical protein